MDVKNLGTQPVAVHLRVDGPGGNGAKNSITSQVALKPGETRTLTVPLRCKLPVALAEKLFGMRGYPGGDAKEDGLDVSKITQLIVFLHHPKADHKFQLSDIRVTGSHQQGNWVTMTADEFFPMIDGFGQFIHKDWPGKIHSEQELQNALERELAEPAAQPGPAPGSIWRPGRGPQPKSTGFFDPLKHEGKWRPVDPEGRLFWSHGVDCAGFGEEIYADHGSGVLFDELPSDDSPLAKFYGQGSWAPHNYYENKGTIARSTSAVPTATQVWHGLAAEGCRDRATAACGPGP